MSGLFGGKDPFDDPFFTYPFGGKNPFDDPFFTHPFDSQVGSKRQISIEELKSEDDTPNHSLPSKQEVIVKHPNDYVDGSHSFSYQRVAYGGVNGIYYSTSIGKRTGGDGVVLVDIKEEDKSENVTLHTFLRGIHDK